MRVALLTTVAAAALSLSVAAVAQTSGGASGGSSGGSSGGTTVAPGTSGGASGGTSGGTSGGAASGTSGGTSGGTTSGGTTSGGAAGGTSSGAAGGTSGGTSSGTTSGGAASGTSGGTAGGTAAGASSSTTVNITGEQRTRAVETLRSVNIRPVQQNVTISVGQTVPTTVTELVDCPTTLESLITGVRDCKVVLVGNRYYIVEGSSRRVVTVIER